MTAPARLLAPTALLAAVTLLGACAIQQTVKPVDLPPAQEVCVIQDLAVRPGFLETYIRVLAEKGYRVRQLAPGSELTVCPVSSTYVGRWSWDLALYMSYAEIRVYRDGKPAGEAVYDATAGGANMGKFIKGETKIAELVDQLFPGKAGRARTGS